MRPRPNGAGPREWDRFCEWIERNLAQLSSDHATALWSAWAEGRHSLMVAAELRQQELMRRNTELVEKNRVLESQVKRLRTVLKEEL